MASVNYAKDDILERQINCFVILTSLYVTKTSHHCHSIMDKSDVLVV
jgi:hypothetical protein